MLGKHRPLVSKCIRGIHIHLFFISVFTTLVLAFFTYAAVASFPQKAEALTQETYWLSLYRKSEVEYLYYGVPGVVEKSVLIKEFQVNTGIPGQKPTPLPELLGKEYWTIVNKSESQDNGETAPFFLTLDIPVSDMPPYGPTPYEECAGQCNWEIPGYFGLHGIAGDTTRLTDAGSSGCIRHSDEDITYLYNLLEPDKEVIRYYVEDK